ncbi:MAG: SIMPL domain-containing protein [Candidatus Omnitrophica bacterium]|nr:SIMPL domain-containing protein [Candidatus Omnitrophota bacterium]
MEKGTFLKNSQIVILGLCIASATIIASVILSQGALKIMKFTKENITVTGSAQKEIRSDFIVWQCAFSSRDADLSTAYKKVAEDLKKVNEYLDSKQTGLQDRSVKQVMTEMIYKKNKDGKDTNEIEGYNLTQVIEIRSKEVDKIAAVSRESTELINQNIEFISASPQYFYIDLDQLKVEMLGKATANAKKRAESMVNSTGNRIGLMRSAKMGVFQITPVTSTDISDYGENDTSSLEKKVMAVVSVSFAIE